jgi:hypothetical protein
MDCLMRVGWRVWGGAWGECWVLKPKKSGSKYSI